MSQIKLGIGLPAYGAKVVMWQAEFWLSMGFALATSEQRFMLKSFGYLDTCGVDTARNLLVSEALESNCDWLFMLDADTWHEGQAGSAGYDILQMISDADRAENCVYVGAPVPCRAEDDKLVYAIYEKYPQFAKPIDYMGRLTEVDSMGAAICAINLNFLRKHDIKPPWFKFPWKAGDIKPWCGEDVFFCHKVKPFGGRALVDGRFVGKHMQKPKVIK